MSPWNNSRILKGTGDSRILNVTVRDTQQLWETTGNMDMELLRILKETAGNTQQLWETTGDMEQLQNPEEDSQKQSATMGDNRRHKANPEF